ncbi:calcium-activated chloride channel regulator 1-like [Hyla sarda]|uniref:calcium-activated chloride channel regulator 1-like n=1 Tax=Hyla sarda TaxID=327740 RepID=UPI0024C407E4|nr:calcium-activated chloride channel regulator 1-like [Hyla sarda]
MRNTLSVIIFLHIVSITQTSFIRLNNGSYEEIVIAINPGEQEDGALIEKIKEMVNDASLYLFQVTQNRVSIGNVKILIPLTWMSTNKYTARTRETYQKADVIISNPAVNSGDGPYTVQYRGCGEPGENIHLTPNYLLNTSLSSMYGPPGRTFVHEWAHLRWGVFDEYNTKIPYYISGELKVEATRCSAGLKGSDMIEECKEGTCSLRDCKIDPNTGLYERGCLFLPEKVQDVQESIMYSAALPSITSFCNSNNHNIEAPSLQNRICYGRSAWDIIVNSTDIISTSPRSSSGLPAPTFTLLQYKPRVITLAYDISGSMVTSNRIGRLLQGTEFFLSQIVETGSYVGIVEFDTFAYVRSPLVHIKSEGDREKLRSGVLLEVSDYVGDLCKGIREALKVNEGLDGSAAGSEILLAFDGESNFAKCTKEVSASGAVIHVMALGPDASAELEHIADMTGGQKHYIPDTSNGSDLLNAFSAISSQNGDVTQQPVLLESRSLDLAPGGCLNGTIFIDSTVGASTFFLVTWRSTVPSIHLQDPNGKCYTEAEFINNTHSSSSRLQIPGKAETGAWNYSLCNNLDINREVGIIVTSKAAGENVPPVTINVHMNTDTNDYPDPMIIYTSVRQDLLPVTNLHVTATVEAESGRTVTVELLDNGAGADVFRNDGVYSRYFTSFSENGRYNLKVHVESQEGKNGLVLLRSHALHIPGYIEDGRILLNHPRPPVSAEDLRIIVGHISRMASGGTFIVNKVPAAPQVITHKPCRITDLEANVKGNSVVLLWTATGGDLDQGQASQYDLRMSRNPRDLRDNFKDSALIDVSGLTPQRFGSQESFTFHPRNMSDKNGIVLFFALTAINQKNQESDISNIAQTVILSSSSPETSTVISVTPQGVSSSQSGTSISPPTTSHTTPTSETFPSTDTPKTLSFSSSVTSVSIFPSSIVTSPPNGVSASNSTTSGWIPTEITGTTVLSTTFSQTIPPTTSERIPTENTGTTVLSTTYSKTIPPTTSERISMGNTGTPVLSTSFSKTIPTTSERIPTENTGTTVLSTTFSQTIPPTTSERIPTENNATTVPSTTFSKTIPSTNFTQPPNGPANTATDSSVTPTSSATGESDSTGTLLTKNTTVAAPSTITPNSSPANINVEKNVNMINIMLELNGKQRKAQQDLTVNQRIHCDKKVKLRCENLFATNRTLSESSLNSSSSSLVKLNNGGYQDIVIAINPAVPENPKIIENIEHIAIPLVHILI